MPKLYYIPDERVGTSLALKEDKWFIKFQSLLLWMANTYYGRDLLGIPKDFPKITKFTKNAIISWIEKDRCVGDFRIGAKWANVIRFRWQEFNEYATYCPIFKWKKSEKNRFGEFGLQPALMPAFNTGTFYPDPDPESTTVDGYVTRDETASWSTVRDNTDGTASNDNINTVEVNQRGISSRYIIRRVFTLFNTSSVGVGATINSGIFSIYANDKGDAANTDEQCVIATTPASNTALTTADYDQIGSTLLSDTKVKPSTISTVAYSNFTLNASGLAAISLTGITKMGMRGYTNDLLNSAPINTDSRITYYSADASGTSTDPKLYVDWTPGGGGTTYPRKIMGITPTKIDGIVVSATTKVEGI